MQMKQADDVRKSQQDKIRGECIDKGEALWDLSRKKRASICIGLGKKMSLIGQNSFM